MKIEHKTFPLEVKEIGAEGEFSGYVSVFNNVDMYRDIVLPGAFKASLAEWKKKKRLPPILWQHYSTEPIGPFTLLQEDEKGLYFEGRLLVADVARAREAHALIKNNVVSGMSVGFETKVEEWDKTELVRKLHKVNLWEGSVVTFPANDAAQIESIKALMGHGTLPDLKSFEKFLREAGFSKSQATAIANRGLLHLLRSESEGNGNPDTAAITAALKTLSIR